MEETQKEIRFYGVKPNKPLVRLIERQIEKWTHRLSHSLSPHDEPAENRGMFVESLIPALKGVAAPAQVPRMESFRL